MFESIVGLEIMVFHRMKAGDIPKGSRVLLLSLIGSPNGVTMAWTKLKCLVLGVRRVILSKKISRDFTSVTILLIIEDLAAKWKKKKNCFDLTMKNEILIEKEKIFSRIINSYWLDKFLFHFYSRIFLI